MNHTHLCKAVTIGIHNVHTLIIKDTDAYHKADSKWKQKASGRSFVKTVSEKSLFTQKARNNQQKKERNKQTTNTERMHQLINDRK